MTARLLPALAGLGIAMLLAVGAHSLLSGGQPAARITVVAPRSPLPPPAPGATAGVPVPLPAAPPRPDPLQGLWGAVNHDTAAYVRGEITILNELGAALARELSHLLEHPAGP